MTRISDIDSENMNTYQSPILTFDVDWAHDDILKDAIDLVEHYKHPATWMMTHQTDLAHELRRNSIHEVGIHPNFNDLLNGDCRNGRSAAEVLDKLMTHYPDSHVVRSHSVVQSSRLSQLFHDYGIRYESNDYLPSGAVLHIAPWRLPCGLVKVPYFFSDELACIDPSIDMAMLYKRSGLKIFVFHPIHTFLNTENLNRYEQTRVLHYNPRELIKHRYEGYGARSRLIELLEMFKTL